MQTFYTPNSQNVPLFRGKNEINFSGSVAIAPLSSRGANFQFAYAPVNHIGVMCNFQLWGAKWSDNSPLYQEGSNRGTLLELGGGYFTKLNEKMVFETYAGYGWITSENGYPYNTSSKIKGNKYFIQVSTGWHIKSVSFGPTVRVVGLDYKEFEYKDRYNNTPDPKYQAIFDNPFNVFIEPGFVFRGGKEIMFKAQVTFSIPTDNSDAIYDPLCINVGILIPIKLKKLDHNKIKIDN